MFIVPEVVIGPPVIVNALPVSVISILVTPEPESLTHSTTPNEETASLCPFPPIPNAANEFAPSANNIYPLVYAANPVPQFTSFNVPAKVIVPLAVIGPPLVVKPVVPPLTSTEVTEPAPALI